MKNIHPTLTFFSSLLLSVTMINAYGDSHQTLYQLTLKKDVQSILISHNPNLLSDTRGPSFTLTQGTAASRLITMIDNNGGGAGAGYYSSTDCSTGFITNSADTLGDTFTFTDNQAIYFGENALSALSSGDLSTQCIKLVLNELASGPRAFLGLKIQNLTCDGITCTGGDVCYTTPNNGQWGTASTPAC